MLSSDDSGLSSIHGRLLVLWYLEFPKTVTANVHKLIRPTHKEWLEFNNCVAWVPCFFVGVGYFFPQTFEISRQKMMLEKLRKRTVYSMESKTNIILLIVLLGINLTPYFFIVDLILSREFFKIQNEFSIFQRISSVDYHPK